MHPSVNCIDRLGSQFPIRLVKRNGAFKFAARIQNTDFAAAKARAGFRIVDGLTLLWKHRLNARSFKNFPAPSVRFYFNYCH
jgi:hypothetical protein